MTTIQYRKHIEDLIDSEETILMDCVDLIKRRIPLKQWSYDVRTAFLLAIQFNGENKEAYKAYTTARHLRIDRNSLPLPPDKLESKYYRYAERIRADLLHFVKLGEGSFL